MKIILIYISIILLIAACSNKEAVKNNNEYAIIHHAAVKGGEMNNPEADSILITNTFLNVSIPNPLKTNSTFIYSIAGSAEVTIDILNLRRDLVYRMNIEKNAGEHLCFLKTFDMKGKGINPGSYFLEVKAKAKDGKEYKEMAQVRVIEGY